MRDQGAEMGTCLLLCSFIFERYYIIISFPPSDSRSKLLRKCPQIGSTPCSHLIM